MHLTGPRLTVFYDGGYFQQGQVYFRHKERRGWIKLTEFHHLLERYVAAKVDLAGDTVRVVGAHYYDGRAAAKATRSEQLVLDRDFELALIHAGITPHYLPTAEGPRGSTQADESRPQVIQKGVDVQLAVDALDLAHTNRYDVAVLVTGDADFLPLVRRIASLNRPVLLVYFEFDAWTDDRGATHRGTFVSRALAEASIWTLDVVRWVKEAKVHKEVDALFIPATASG